jgi:hypothetical protein
VSSSLVRNVTGCGGSFGDGIAAYDYPFSRAVLAVDATRVSDVSRAAIATFGASISIGTSGLEGCSAIASAPSAAGAGHTDSRATLCACRGTWAACTSNDSNSAPLDPALFGYPACNPDTMACVTGCVTDTNTFTGNGAPVVGYVGWSDTADSFGSTVTNARGCSEAAYPIGRRLLQRGGSPATAQDLGFWRVAHAGSLSSTNVPDTAMLVVGVQPGLLGPDNLHPREQPDLRNSTFLAFGVCALPKDPSATPREDCVGHGVEGVTAELLSPSGAPLTGSSASWATPCYFGAGALACNGSTGVTAVTSNAYGYFYNVPPGDYWLRLSHPSKLLSCKLDPGSGIEIGHAVEGQPNTYDLPAFAGVLDALIVYCTLN